MAHGRLLRELWHLHTVVHCVAIKNFGWWENIFWHQKNETLESFKKPVIKYTQHHLNATE